MPAASKTSKSTSRTTKARPASRAPYVYVYCAVDGAVTARTLKGLATLPDGAKPRVVPLDDGLSLVVADVPAAVYHAAAVESRLGDLDWVGRCGSAHHAVADTLVAGHTVVPLRPFTLFSSETRARKTFISMLDDLRAAVDRVTGKAEWVLRVGRPDPARMSVDSAQVDKSKGATSGTAFLAQKAAAKQAVADLAARVRHDASALFDSLAALASQSERRTPEAKTGLVLDAVFLVGTNDAARFKQTLEAEAAGLLRDGCRISLTGPWPPYSFVAVDPGRHRG
jgi:Gas vesicle synthesis protein GvpL/GvpF